MQWKKAIRILRGRHQFLQQKAQERINEGQEAYLCIAELAAVREALAALEYVQQTSIAVCRPPHVSTLFDWPVRRDQSSAVPQVDQDADNSCAFSVSK